jgi:hypothetical protein
MSTTPAIRYIGHVEPAASVGRRRVDEVRSERVTGEEAAAECERRE